MGDLLSLYPAKRHSGVYAQGKVVVPPGQETEVTARSTLLTPSLVGPDCIVETHQVRPGLYVGRTLLPPSHHDLKVRMVNTTNQPLTVDDGMCIGNLSPVTVLESSANENVQGEVSQVSPSPSELKTTAEVITTMLSNLPDGLSLNERDKVSGLLYEYSDLFSRGPLDMGRTTLVEHTIDTGEHRPIRQGLRRHPLAHLDEIDRQVETLLQNDFVEPSASPWASNVVLVRKKDGSHRLCVDYRMINEITRKDSYPLPHIDTCLGSMDGALYFSTLDLRSGYHNIPIKDCDKDKTSFITRKGCFRYKVLPFGLTTAPSVFQRLMDFVLCGLTYASCLVYLDDIIVFAPDFETHVLRLQEVFERLRSANLKLHPSKCFLFQRRVAFLGHTLSENGIEVQTEKIDAIREWSRPRNVREVRQFMGTCSYYRRFILGFADIAAPLYALLRKNATFHWEDEQERAFIRLKEALSSTPILGMPTANDVFYLDTDASDIGLGAVLSQKQGEREVVIAYASRVLTNSERNYDVTKRELLAVVFGLKTFRQYLLGRHFVVRTDHSALQWIRRTPEPMGQLARWMTLLEQYDFAIQHRPGAKHGNADGLSRRPASDEGEMSTEANVRGAKVKTIPTTAKLGENQGPNFGAVGKNNIAELQAKDPDIGPILRLRLQQTDRPNPDLLVSESPFAKRLCSEWNSLEVHDGVIYRRFQYSDGRPDTLQLLLPRTMRKEFLSNIHSGMSGGHMGIRRTLDQVRRRAFWQGWRRNTQNHCKRCVHCNSYFRGKLPRTAPLQPMLTGAPFERLHIDMTGPHPITARKSRFIVSIICPFTKWAECFPVHSKEASVVARIIVEQVICRFGVPLSILTDNAKELDGDLMTEICKLLKIEKFRTTVYKPSTNAAVERFHRTLNSMLAKMIDKERDWDLMLPYVMAAYRSSRHESTNFTPNFLMLGREVHTPVDVVYGTVEAKIPASYADYSDEMLERFQRAYTLVREHLREAAKRTKRYYDMHVRTAQYKVGDWVMFYNPRKRPGRQDKWVPKFSGPWLVTKVTGPVNVMIQRNKRGREVICHFDKLKPYVADVMPTSWLQNDGNAQNPSKTHQARPEGDNEIEANSPGYVHPSVGENNENLWSDNVGSESESGRTDLETGVRDQTGGANVEPSQDETLVKGAADFAGVQETFRGNDFGGDGQDIMGESQSPFPIAGDPLSNPLPFRPRRSARKPERYRD